MVSWLFYAVLAWYIVYFYIGLLTDSFLFGVSEDQ